MSTDNVEATEAVITDAPEAEGSFFDGWSDDLKDDPSLSKFKDEQEIFRSYKELQKTVGYKGDIPKPEAEADEWNTFYGKLGKPADQAGYEFGAVDGMDVDDGYMGKVREVALKHNLTKAQAEGFVSEMMGYEKGLLEEQQATSTQQSEDDQKMLNDAWGEAKGEMVVSIRNMLGTIGVSEEEAQSFENDPKSLLMLGKLAEKIGERGQVGDSVNATTQGLQDQMGEIEASITRIARGGRGDVRNPELDNLLAQRARLQDKLLAR